jgi:hypothetical protein
MYDFNKIYDNGKKLIGITSRILAYINFQIENMPLDGDTTEFYVELKDELLNYNQDSLLIINYDHPMGYEIDVVEESDAVYG